MLKKILVASFLLVASMGSQATIIEYASYKRDMSGTCAATETDCKYNIVTGGGLEWLKWDVTKGQSINQALVANAGWKLATNVQMASLFNSFQFGKTDWSADESRLQLHATPWSVGEDSTHNIFMQLFGHTLKLGSGGYSATDPHQITAALFGNDTNGNNLYNYASVHDDFQGAPWGAVGALAFLTEDKYDATAFNFGVALVREVRVVPPTQVSLPGSLSLLALGFVALGFRRRKA